MHSNILQRGGLIFGITFVSGVFHTCFLYFRKEKWNKTKKTMLLQQNSDLLLDSKQNTWCLSCSNKMKSKQLGIWMSTLTKVRSLQKLWLCFVEKTDNYNFADGNTIYSCAKSVKRCYRPSLIWPEGGIKMV